MQKRLVELIKQAENNFSKTGKLVLDIEEYVASHLLANGVIVPPVKVGQTVYYPIHYTNKVEQLFVREIVYTGKKIQFYASYVAFTVDDIGKTVFLTREQAERALQERSEG